jgi:hypothetical protein
MHKENRFVNGIYRILNVLAFTAFGFGEIIIYFATAPQKAYTYTNHTTGMITSVPAKPFQLDDFLALSVGLVVALFILYMTIVYIINGFRNGRTNE